MAGNISGLVTMVGGSGGGGGGGAVAGVGNDPWTVSPDERSRFDEQFLQQKPVQGMVTGEQAKRFFLQSQLPPIILGHIWSLADTNADGKMDRNEFAIAMKLVQMKLKGFELPKILPPNLRALVMSPGQGVVPIGAMASAAFPPSSQFGPTTSTSKGSQIHAVNVGVMGQSSPQSRSASVSSLESPTTVAGGLQEWAIPYQSRLKYTQLFNTHDRMCSGYLTGPQARNVLVQTGLSQAILAQIWALSDLDNDGRLGCEEFCVALHLSECVKAGDKLPASLPTDLVPPSFRTKSASRSSSLTSGTLGTGMNVAVDVLSSSISSIPDLLSGDVKDDEKIKAAAMATFEDKRRENFEKGQAELERRRQALLESQRKEREERERKEREEQERREKIRQEQERRRQQELERQLAKQREIEQEKEEQRRRALEQREAARREMERQRQLEWEKQRRQELLAQRHREQEKVLQLKARNQTLNVELEQLTDKVRELNRRIGETRGGVADIKGTIDQMRATRDSKIDEMDSVKKQIKDQNQKLILLNQEKIGLADQVKVNSVNNPTADSFNALMHGFGNRQMAIKTLRERVSTVESDVSQKLVDIETNNKQLEDLKLQISKLLSGSEDLYGLYEERRNAVLELLRQHKKLDSGGGSMEAVTFDSTRDSFGGVSNDAWAKDAWPVADESSTTAWSNVGVETASTTWGGNDEWPIDAATSPGRTGDGWCTVTTSAKYRVLYAFEARNPDELSIMPGDIVTVFVGQVSEPGWMSGEFKGKTGWFPESYVEPLSGTENGANNFTGTTTTTISDDNRETVHIVGTEIKMTLSGIQEAPESISDNGSILSETSAITETQPPQSSAFVQVMKSSIVGTSPVPGQGEEVEGILARAQFPWRAKKENHLSFNKGDLILIQERQDIWWFGELEGRRGWFPKSYVKLHVAGPVVNSLRDIQSVADSGSTPGEYYVAMYTYQSSEPGDLMFNQGDTVLVIKADGDWWTGTIGDRSGIFPSNYVKKIDEDESRQSEPPPEPEEEAPNYPDLKLGEIDLSDGDFKREAPEPPDTPKSRGGGGGGVIAGKKHEIAMVIAPYLATGSEQLGLQKGQLISIRKKNSSGWWEGELHAKGKKRQVGWFPASYVKLLSSESSARSTPEPSQSRDEPKELVIALYPYNAQNEDELNFTKDAVINVIGKDDDAWWRGECNGAVGVFPSNYVRPYDTSGGGGGDVYSALDDDSSFSLLNTLNRLTPLEKKRQGYIHELITTEETYMDDMVIVLDAFRKPLKETRVVTDQELDIIFVNWRELIKCNVKLLKALRVRRKMSKNGVIHMIGDILCENLPHMSPYIRFCSCQLNAAAIIQNKTENSQEFRDVAKKCQADPRTKGMPVSSFLLKPMQRITRYPLTVKKILENTLESHPDYGNLQEALGRAEELCSQVNEGVRERENSDRLEWLQRCVNCDSLPERITFNSLTNSLGPRKFLHSGILVKTKSGKELTAFLFNDFLLLTQPTKSGGLVGAIGVGSSSSSSRPKSVILDMSANAQYKIYRKPIFLNEITVDTDMDTKSSDGIHIRHTLHTYHFKAANSNERNVWARKLESASKHYQDVERHSKERNQSFRPQERPVLGRLLVVVLEALYLKAKANVRKRRPKGILKLIIVDASNLVFNKLKGRSDPYCEVSMGSQEHRTKVVNDTVNPKWNASMQFKIKDTKEDVLCITVFDRDYFSPNDFLGRTEIRIEEILNETRKTMGPILMTKALHEVDSGEVVVKLDLQLFHK